MGPGIFTKYAKPVIGALIAILVIVAIVVAGAN